MIYNYNCFCIIIIAIATLICSARNELNKDIKQKRTIPFSCEAKVYISYRPIMNVVHVHVYIENDMCTKVKLSHVCMLNEQDESEIYLSILYILLLYILTDC